MADQLVTPSVVAKLRKRILLVEDHELFRSALRDLLKSQPEMEVCGEAADADEALRIAIESSPDLVIVDLGLKGSDGLRLIERLKAHNASIATLVVSAREAELYAERALRAGAAGYVEKGESAVEILQAVRRVLAREIYLSHELASRMLRRSARPEERSPIETFSTRELEVFRLIGRGAPTREIAKELSISPSTVDTYRERLKTKLNLRNGAELTRSALQWVMENG